MFRLRALLWRPALSLPQLDSSVPCLRNTNPLLGSSTAWDFQTSPAHMWQRQQPYSSSFCTAEEEEDSVRQPRQAAKSAATPVPGWSAGEFAVGPRTTALTRQSRKSTRALNQPHSSGGPRARPSSWKLVDELKAKDTCEGVWDMLSKIPPQEIPVSILSAALDHMVAISKRPGYQQNQEGLSAVQQLLIIAECRLGSMDSWGMAAFIRFAAGYRGILQPAGLSAWQRELLQRPKLVEQLTEQGVANTLLSLGTVADSDPQLASELDTQLLGQLLQHAVSLACAPSNRAVFLARHAANVLYGAALLGLQPDKAEVVVLFAAVQRDLKGLEEKGVSQVLLASQKLMGRAAGLRLEHGLETRHPDVDPYNIYYPGNQLMGLLLEQACELIQQQRFCLQAASQLLGACGAMGYLPSDSALQELVADVYCCYTVCHGM